MTLYVRRTKPGRVVQLSNSLGVVCPAGIQLTLQIQSSLDPKPTRKDFREALADGEKHQQRVAELKGEVEAFAGHFPMPGLPEL